MGNCAVRFLSNETNTNANANSGINSKQTSFMKVFLLIFVTLSLNLLTKLFPACLVILNVTVLQIRLSGNLIGGFPWQRASSKTRASVVVRTRKKGVHSSSRVAWIVVIEVYILQSMVF